MQNALMILPILVPVLFWAGYHYHKDRHLPEPLAHLLLVFVLGMFAAGISKGLYVSLDYVGLRYDAGALADSSTVGLFFYALLAIGPIEEFAKLLPFLLIVVRLDEFDEPLDGIIYASFLGLGYAAVENWQYLDYLTPLEAILRGFASPIVHILFASIWGYWVARAVMTNRSIAIAATLGLAIAAALHGLYDFMVIMRPRSALPLAALLILGVWVWRLKLMRNLQRQASED